LPTWARDARHPVMRHRTGRVSGRRRWLRSDQLDLRFSLAFAKILDNMEIGHNVMHGQYDWTGDPTLNSQTFEWDIACDGEQWRHSHNVEHHDHTNTGKDHDFGYGMLRLSENRNGSRVICCNPFRIYCWRYISNGAWRCMTSKSAASLKAA
jgi:fatty acid desaturase